MEIYWLNLFYLWLFCPFLILCQKGEGESCREPDLPCDRTAGLHCSPKPRGVCQECGLNNRQNTDSIRIVGGKPTDPKAWPWMAGITKEISREFPFCGGTLLTDRHVLTAAHCITNFAPKDLIVRLGEYDFSKRGDNSPMDFEIEKMKLHEEYNAKTVDNDIAIITLRTEVKFNEFIWPACLPPPNVNFVDQVGLVAGWGTKYFEGPTNSVLHEAAVKVWNQDECTQTYADRVVTDNMMCCGWATGGVDSCHGDSGGPLMLQIPGSKRWILIGLVSWGRGCASPNLPGVYTKVSNYLEWINIHLTYVEAPAKVVLRQEECDNGYEYFKEIDWCVKPNAKGIGWNQVRQECAAEGGTYGIVDTEEKRAALTDLMKKRDISGVWIGLSAKLERGKYVWADGTPVTFSSWGGGQPDDAGNNEDCVQFSAGWGYKWNDESCIKQFGYLCEKTRKKIAACPPSYVYFRVLDWCVKPSTTIRSWNEVPEACAAEGGTFSVVDTKEKHVAIANMMRTKDISGLWIGLSATVEKGKFVWVDGTPVTNQTFSSWGKGQPDDAGHDENCVHFSAGWDYKWNDESCKKQFKFLCEMKRNL